MWAQHKDKVLKPISWLPRWEARVHDRRSRAFSEGRWRSLRCPGCWLTLAPFCRLSLHGGRQRVLWRSAAEAGIVGGDPMETSDEFRLCSRSQGDWGAFSSPFSRHEQTPMTSYTYINNYYTHMSNIELSDNLLCNMCNCFIIVWAFLFYFIFFFNYVILRIIGHNFPLQLIVLSYLFVSVGPDTKVQEVKSRLNRDNVWPMNSSGKHLFSHQEEATVDTMTCNWHGI